MSSRATGFLPGPVAAAAALLVLATPSAPARAASPAVCEALRIKVIDVGLYEPIAHAEVADIEDTDHQQVNGAMAFVRETRDVPAVIGRMFGFTWLATGFEPGAPTLLRVEIDHPIIETPGRGRSNGVSSRFPVTSRDGRYRNAVAWQLTERHELVQGEWTLRLACGGRVLAEERFELTEADAY
jgi:hypothetical protein